MRDHIAEADIALKLAKARALDALAFVGLAGALLLVVISASMVFHF